MDSGFKKHRISNIINIQNIVSLHYFEFDRNFVTHGESHNFWELIYADKGDICINTGNNTFTLRQGECYFHKPNEFHIHSADGNVAPNIFISAFVCTSNTMKLFRSKKFYVPASLRPVISSIIDESRKSFDLPFNRTEFIPLKPREDAILGGQQMVRTYLEQFLILLLRNEYSDSNEVVLSTINATAEHLAVQMKKKIEVSAYEDISVSQLCTEMRYSKTYLSKVFFNNFGYSINTYISKVKIEEAKKLIREHTHNFSQIADMLCFSNPFYFSRVFRRVTGMSPTEYKKSVKID